MSPGSDCESVHVCMRACLHACRAVGHVLQASSTPESAFSVPFFCVIAPNNKKSGVGNLSRLFAFRLVWGSLCHRCKRPSGPLTQTQTRPFVYFLKKKVEFVHTALDNFEASLSKSIPGGMEALYIGSVSLFVGIANRMSGAVTRLCLDENDKFLH